MKSNKLSNYFKNSNVNYCKGAKIYLVFMAALLVSAIIIVSVIGFKLGFDFTGGTIVEVVYGVEFDANGNPYENGSPYDKETTIKYLDEVFSEIGNMQLASVQTENGSFGDTVVYKLLSSEKPTQEELDAIKTMLYEKFSEYDQNGLLQQNYISVYTVGDTKSDVAVYSSIALSVAIVLLAIGALIRFGVSGGLSIFISTLLNVMLAFVVVLICRITVNVPFIASVFTIFVLSAISNLIYLDKVRDNSVKKELSREEVANLSAKQSAPAILLILAVSLICLVLLTGFGVLPIREFALPVMVGIFFVALSTTFALPLLWKEIVFKKKKNKSGN